MYVYICIYYYSAKAKETYCNSKTVDIILILYNINISNVHAYTSSLQVCMVNNNKISLVLWKHNINLQLQY